MTNSSTEANVDWRLPAGKPDWLFGTGATRTERWVVWLGTAAAVAVLAATAAAQDAAWSWWQWALVLALTMDVAGGVPANSLATAKRLYHSPAPACQPLRRRLLRHHTSFSALHLHPFLVALVLPDASLRWAATWYLIALAGTVAVVRAPLYLHRPIAAAWTTAAVIAAPLVAAPVGLGWLGPVLVLKLVAAHAVREEPYRPQLTPASALTGQAHS
jgi:hypothetical protein